MKRIWNESWWILKIALGSAIFSFGFNMFLEPHGMNAGGVSGLAMVLVHLFEFGTVGTVTAIMNLILFVVGGLKIGKRFLIGSMVGAAVVSVTLDILAGIPAPAADPLLAALYGGVICGGGLGMVFATGASTGGSDIVVRLLKRKWQNVPIGTINIIFDLTVATLTGIAFQEVASGLYSGVAIFICGKVIDLMVYSLDYSKVALIISEEHDQIRLQVLQQLSRGVTVLKGEGGYSKEDKRVLLTAVKQYQVAELKQLVAKIDPDAFVIVQDAHQVLGDGFSRYSSDSL